MGFQQTTQPSKTVPTKPTSNTHASGNGMRSVRNMRGNRDLGSIPMMPDAMPPHGLPDTRTKQQQTGGSESGRK